MTLEEAMNKILDLKGQLQEKEQMIESLNNLKTAQEEQISGYSNEINKLKEHNMSLFLRLTSEADEVEAEQVIEESKAGTDWDSFLNEW